RVAAAVLEQPIGICGGNEVLFEEQWRSWGKELMARRADIDAATLEMFGSTMWGGDDFVLSVSRDDVRSTNTPLLVLPGADEFHPTSIAREIATLAPRGEILGSWNETPESLASTAVSVRQFLRRHTPDQ
ncbi:MAG TPA: hypothetical protein VNW92_12495, partial [Polyangiaceae bacterium]|nr:hypothetical protein [Polyangiaceae bacterium]